MYFKYFVFFYGLENFSLFLCILHIVPLIPLLRMHKHFNFEKNKIKIFIKCYLLVFKLRRFLYTSGICCMIIIKLFYISLLLVYNKNKSFMHCIYVYKRHTKQFIVTNLVSMLIPLGDPY